MIEWALRLGYLGAVPTNFVCKKSYREIINKIHVQRSAVIVKNLNEYYELVYYVLQKHHLTSNLLMLQTEMMINVGFFFYNQLNIYLLIFELIK